MTLDHLTRNMAPARSADRNDYERKLRSMPWETPPAERLAYAKRMIAAEQSYLALEDWQIGPNPEAFRAERRAAKERWTEETDRLRAALR